MLGLADAIKDIIYFNRFNFTKPSRYRLTPIFYITLADSHFFRSLDYVMHIYADKKNVDKNESYIRQAIMSCRLQKMA